MSDLSVFSQEELELLVSLPYKAGMWVSEADDEEGETDDEKEVQALESCIKAIAKNYDDQPFVQKIMSQTINLKTEWPRWGDQCFKAVSDAEQAASLLKSKASADEFKSYRAAVMEVAQTVADAYGEFGSFDEDEEKGGIFSALASKISALSHDDDSHPMNTSPAEDSAISQLAAALRSGE